ncbi:MAG: hypothetical protein HRF46_16660 [Acidobacteriota bacterium]|jgi:hypothetical protein
MRGLLAFALTICALTATAQAADGPVERITLAAELGGGHLVPLLSAGGELLLAAPSRSGEPLATALWRWQDGRTSRIAELSGIRTNHLRALEGDGGGRRLLLGGGIPLAGAQQGVAYGWQVVELPPEGPPRLVWQSSDIAGLPANLEPSVAVDARGQRWAALVPRSQAGRAMGGRLLVGELPRSTPSLEYEFLLERDPSAASDSEPSWFVRFAGASRLVVVAEGLPILLDVGADGVRRTPLAVPSPPARDAHVHEASATVWLTDDGAALHGYALPAHNSAPATAPLTSAWRLGPAEVGFGHGRVLGSVGDRLAILGARDGRQMVAFVRVDGQHTPTVEKTVALPGGAQPAGAWLSPDGATLVWTQVGTGGARAPVFYRAAVARLESVR